MTRRACPKRAAWPMAVGLALGVGVCGVVGWGIIGCGGGRETSAPGASTTEPARSEAPGSPEGAWVVTELAGQSPGEGPAPTLAIPADGGQVSGQTGCNRYQAELTVTGQRLRLGPVAATKRACPGPRMTTERRFLEALSAVARFELAADGHTLRLFDDAGRPVLRANRDAGDLSAP
ncbi:MAG TPA: META domain-containing protein [Polyangiaceae bacterium LLY-WYZ-14_1]|nr:META domain-containing protein [Polyangiaceae bacterium LLY-WYZ-14_1]